MTAMDSSQYMLEKAMTLSFSPSITTMAGVGILLVVSNWISKGDNTEAADNGHDDQSTLERDPGTFAEWGLGSPQTSGPFPRISRNRFRDA